MLSLDNHSSLRFTLMQLALKVMSCAHTSNFALITGNCQVMKAILSNDSSYSEKRLIVASILISVFEVCSQINAVCAVCKRIKFYDVCTLQISLSLRLFSDVCIRAPDRRGN